jgi:hypothetical protein
MNKRKTSQKTKSRNKNTGKANQKKFLSPEDLGLPKKVMFGDEEIELDESMFYGEGYLCRECRELGYCKKKGPPRSNINFPD